MKSARQADARKSESAGRKRAESPRRRSCGTRALDVTLRLAVVSATAALAQCDGILGFAPDEGQPASVPRPRASIGTWRWWVRVLSA